MPGARFQNIVLQGISPFDSLLRELLVCVQLALLLRYSQAAQQRTKLVRIRIFWFLHYLKPRYCSTCEHPFTLGSRIYSSLLVPDTLACDLTARLLPISANLSTGNRRPSSWCRHLSVQSNLTSLYILSLLRDNIDLLMFEGKIVEALCFI